jgi:AraC-like DNA-binding protein
VQFVDQPRPGMLGDCPGMDGIAGAGAQLPAGQSYQERRPARALADLVSCAWIQRVSPDAAPYKHRTTPNGSVELVCRVGSVPQIVGPLTRPMTELRAPGSTVVGVRFHPGAAACVLGVPPSELADLVLDADELWGSPAVAAGDRVAESALPWEGVALLEQLIAGRLADADGPDPLVANAVRRLMHGPADDVGLLRSSLYLSERQFRRRCQATIGVAPKALHRMLRFQGFLARIQVALARGRKPADGGLARLAADAGYADQSHLTRECVRLTGVTPRVFLSETEQRCGCGHDHQVSSAPLLRSRSASRSAPA